MKMPKLNRCEKLKVGNVLITHGMLFTLFLIPPMHEITFCPNFHTHPMMFSMARAFVTESVLMDVLGEEDVDVDPRFRTLANAFHRFVQTVAQQFLPCRPTHRDGNYE